MHRWQNSCDVGFSRLTDLGLVLESVRYRDLGTIRYTHPHRLDISLSHGSSTKLGKK